jgi:putative transposase
MLEHQIKMGRDALFDLLSKHSLLVKRRKRGVRTTQSFHLMRKYSNLIRDYIPSAPNKLWVSDITYWKILSGFAYISFVTDAYSHKILGYNVAATLDAIETIKALQVALLELNEPPSGLIHHSDRGIQYCSANYVQLLQANNIGISMTESGDPLENALAERVNGIIKNEYLDCYQVESIPEARTLLGEVIKLYNSERPHMSLGNLTPNQVHIYHLKKQNLWKKH